MANGARIAVNFPVVAALIGLVTKEVNCGVLDTAGLLGFSLEMAKAVRLVPAVREDVERNLTANGEARKSVSERACRRGLQLAAWD